MEKDILNKGVLTLEEVKVLKDALLSVWHLELFTCNKNREDRVMRIISNIQEERIEDYKYYSDIKKPSLRYKTLDHLVEIKNHKH